MFQRILVPLDGSERAERSIPVAVHMARTASGSIILVRIIETPVEYWSSLAQIPSATLVETAIEAEIDEAERYLAAVAASPAMVGVTVQTVTLFGQVAPSILSAANTCNADIILMSSHGYTGMKRWVMGSVAEKIARHSTLPVLILRDSSLLPIAAQSGATSPIRALIPLDGSAHARAALSSAIELVMTLNGHNKGAIHLVRVVKSPSFDESLTVEQQQEVRAHALYRAKRYLISITEQLRDGLIAPSLAGLTMPVTWSVAGDDDAAAGILRIAEKGDDAEGSGTFGGCN
ncbi:MAG TPA: hypothetical protein DHW02_06680, partial [Ktedonobacter sp.]|nr:hypothetical protein [Ktedonobacter sp.]